jgi:hypothetical protein
MQVGCRLGIADRYGIRDDGAQRFRNLFRGIWVLRKKVVTHDFCQRDRALAAIGLMGK